MYDKKWITAYGRYIAKYITKKLRFSVYDAVGLNGLADPVQDYLSWALPNLKKYIFSSPHQKKIR